MESIPDSRFEVSATRAASCAVCVALFLFCSAPAAAVEINENLRIYGHAQLWMTAYEQMEECEELYQHPSGDAAATSTTGFGLNRARASVDVYLLDRLLQLNTQLRLEKNPAILDVYVGLHFARWLRFYAGQFKVPAPRETLTTSRKLDFIFRPVISEYLVDYSLSRNTFFSSLFYGVHSYLRDFGVGLKGDIDIGPATLRYFYMLGNGLGANLFIGGAAKREYMLTNKGQFFQGLRIEAELFGMVTVGGHINYNWHDNMVFNSGRVVYDIKRIAYSTDAVVEIPGTGLRIAGIWGEGEIRDDYDDDDRTDLIYSGWACSLMWRVNEPLANLLPAALERHIFEIGARFDRFEFDRNENGTPVVADRWTVGINYLFDDYLKVQLNYIIKRTDDPSLWDLDDDILLVSLQGAL